MSETLNILKEYNIGYISEDYGLEEKVYPLDKLLEMELIEFKNIDIPLYYLSESILNNFKAIRSGFYSSEKGYNSWLKKNGLEDNSDNKVLFKNDCDYVSIQKNAKKILEVIVQKVCLNLNAIREEVKCFWVTEEQEAFKTIGYLEEVELPLKYECLLDLDKLGVLVAFKS